MGGAPAKIISFLSRSFRAPRGGIGSSSGGERKRVKARFKGMQMRIYAS
jgi:hypothetical protein